MGVGGCVGGGVNRLCSYLSSNRQKRESQEAMRRESEEAKKQTQLQDNDKVKYVLSGSVQSEGDKAQPAFREWETPGGSQV